MNCPLCHKGDTVYSWFIALHIRMFYCWECAHTWENPGNTYSPYAPPRALHGQR